MEEADLILFLVDCTTGITDVDGEVAELLRKSGKSCVLAVNKVDHEKQEPDAAEFIRLGLGEPVVVSALRGRGVGDLLSLVVEKLNLPEGREDVMVDDGVRLAIVGRPNVGKSTFINVILGEERLLVTEVPGTTRDAVDVRFRFNEHEFVLIDTAGIRRRSRVKENVEYYSTLRAHRVVERCDVACIFVDADEGLTQQDLRILREVVDARKGALLVVNKWDLLKEDKDRERQWKDDLEHRLRGITYVPVITVSCKTSLRMEKVLDFAWRISQERRKRVSSPDLNKLIVALDRRYRPPAAQGKRVRVLYGTQVGVAPPRFALFSNRPDLIKEGYKRFLENQIREHLGFEGVPVTLFFRRK